ncbi:MAG: 50S ribosomal protein L32 [Clostridia bacterium]|nr:50S ribosomal protein L32 [Clostridia bacterium]MBQ2252651.1 50S ribosomal protein L32 [Clostridia bacterium]MBQ2731228.1 50S ribosomal protein L32 [Clostridia bacterium]
MAVPKKKTSHARKNSRRASVSKLAAPTLTTCAKCGEKILPHRVCDNCGSYDGKVVIAKEDK